MLVKIYVTPKKAVLDPQGKAVHAGLAHLGFARATDVRVGKYLEVSLDTASRAEAEEMAKAMCERLLANTVIEDYRFDVVEAKAAGTGG